MFEKWNAELLEKLKDDEASKGDIFSRIACETFTQNLHKMELEEGYKKGLLPPYDKALEQADLTDLKAIEKYYDGN